MKNFSFSTSRVLFEHPLTLAAQGELPTNVNNDLTENQTNAIF